MASAARMIRSTLPRNAHDHGLLPLGPGIFRPHRLCGRSRTEEARVGVGQIPIISQCPTTCHILPYPIMLILCGAHGRPAPSMQAVQAREGGCNRESKKRRSHSFFIPRVKSPMYLLHVNMHYY